MKINSPKNSFIRWLACVFAMLLAPLVAYAHVGVGQTGGFAHGLLHPITGLDHLAVMIGVGIWAAQRGGRAIWAVPLTFVVVMSIGGLLGMMGLSLPFVEPGIAASVLVLGIFIAAAVRLPLIASTLLVGVFAIFHGHAHGAEMPETVSGLAYGLGFVIATALLHCSGICLGLSAQKKVSPLVIRYAGGALAVAGLYLCIV